MTPTRSGVHGSRQVVQVCIGTKGETDVRRICSQEESAKRAAFTAFEIDITHAAIFRHSPTLSAFQVQLALPSDEDEWNAFTSKTWSMIHQAAYPPPQFLTALKASLIASSTPPNLSPFARVSVLHGLMSVAFDLQWRDHFMTGLSTPDDATKDWKETISAGYNCWKARLDEALMSASYPANAILRNSIPMYGESFCPDFLYRETRTAGV
jgi:hypothetical protein